MARSTPFPDDMPFSQRVKSLADEELLEIWEETQQVELMLNREMQAAISLAPEYERAIVEELRLRSTRGLCREAR
ncbi:MAG: hypothetical protein HDQ92_00135 [Desulfovibrio sp.]|nr:hypothetical protein [Desulfovibrio sp.]